MDEAASSTDPVHGKDSLPCPLQSNPTLSLDEALGV